ncbi:MAG: hypothetical protein EBW06_10475, partial [Gammaproteobacteria bacterium]|nr:hypothetical protein [Gammaproteobacteria bacterium]
KIDFTVVNGENAAEDGKGITKDIADLFFSLGFYSVINLFEYLVSRVPYSEATGEGNTWVVSETATTGHQLSIIV